MNQPPTKTPPAGLRNFIPQVPFLKAYRGDWFWADLLAGVSVCLVMIPSVIAYAGLLGLPPQYGLYAALIPLLIYPFFASSRHVIVGPDIAISLLMVNAVGPLAGGDPNRTAVLVATTAMLVGIMLVLGSRARIGIVADFLSKPVLVGYMTGAALILVGSQLDKLFGIELLSNDFFPRLIELARKLSLTHLPTLLFGLGLMVALQVLRRKLTRIPPALSICIGAILLSRWLGLEARGVAVVGMFPGGLPRFALPSFDWHDIHTLLPAAIGIALLTYTEGILLARSYAAKHGYEVNANQELAALGLVDLGASFFQGFAVTGSQARTAICDSTGGKTQVASLVAAFTLLLFMLFLTPLIAHLPVVALAVILVTGGLNLVEIRTIQRLYRYYPDSALVTALTIAGVLTLDVVRGILVGVVLSLLGLISRVSHPTDCVLRQVPGHGYHDLGDNPDGETVPGLVAYRYYAPLLFSNSSHFIERVRKITTASRNPVRWFLLDAQAITDMDVTAAEALHALLLEFKHKGIVLKVAHANRPLRQVFERIGLSDEIGEKSFFGSVHECVEEFARADLAN